MHGGVSRTKLAEPYPYPLCASLASACCKHAGWLASSRRLSIVGCAKCQGCSYHIGDARQPGPLPPGRLLMKRDDRCTLACRRCRWRQCCLELAHEDCIGCICEVGLQKDCRSTPRPYRPPPPAPPPDRPPSSTPHPEARVDASVRDLEPGTSATSALVTTGVRLLHIPGNELSDMDSVQSA